jgi:tetratricopeptide (TPR) repeat protein
MFCSNCGNKLADSVKFCSSCGSKINADIDTAETQAVVAPDVTGVEQLWRKARKYYNKGKYELAIKNYTKIIELSEEEDANDYYWRGQSYRMNGNYDAAIEDFTNAMELREEEDANDYYWRGFSYRMSGNYNAAIEDVETALEINPSFEDAKELKRLLSPNNNNCNTGIMDTIKNKFSDVNWDNVIELGGAFLGGAVQGYLEAKKQDENYGRDDDDD